MKLREIRPCSNRLAWTALVFAWIGLAGEASATLSTLSATEVKRFRHYCDWNLGTEECDDESWTCSNQDIRVGFLGTYPYEYYSDRVGMDFDISSIPNNATITKVELKLYLYDIEDGSYGILYKAMPEPVAPAQGAFCFGRWIQVASGNEYLSEYSFIDNYYNTRDLGEDAVDDLQARLDADELQIPDVEDDNDVFTTGLQYTDEGWFYPGSFALAGAGDANPNKLKVTWYILGEEEEPRAAGGEPDDQPSEEKLSWGTIKARY